ncbi:MAG: short-chain dehydrogenase [Burkholderiales bacterium 35-55-47]|jgi:NAD(P)-dependent dehydrogenase (short-subunit alcohol dehydrogenase family)|uniref:SDR family oxidoreductase n=1 Tax=Limnohabitans sp. TaxID=1907725 RepID=UPI000BCDF37B|nr:SDR family oxidoreductase [Limnohabitans sp.]OYY17655.1 MAG: short-chain dehydrogenase [Burkholderiales bacterium 35-55-47]OYZ72036.1 MAG: short-chain dehydrogenase [Burkholderiales bacterium 24-55-52]OZA99046.1 MAG: short-chain dehydrogenase [Burkholderiales bacterium 39-55-53]HQR86889.1 SDR family oxidoreductase [Limnohabitans sp.]HQS27014.1 SDR family oxidoreductase [Limnohabitans sp.]
MRSWALITGGSVRLGREIGLAFARAGWNVACHYNHSETQAHALCAELRALGVDALAVQGELEDEASCQSIFDTTVAITGTALQCVVNNASLFVPDEGADFDEAQALAQIKVNLMAPMRFGKWMAVLHADGAAAHTKPSVIHVLDQKVFNLNPDYFSYTLSKLALERAVSLQAQSLAPTLRVNAVAPGLMYLSGPQTQDNFNRAASANLLRQPINPADVASSVVFLAGNASITGTTVRVDNGQHLVPLARDVMFVVEELFKS